MKKRLLGLLLTAAMLISSIPAVMAEETSVELGYAADWGQNVNYLTTTEDSYTGKASIRLKGSQTGTETRQEVNFDSSKQYKVTLYAKVAAGELVWRWMAKAWLGYEVTAGTNKVSHLDKDGWTKTATDKDGWYKYESTYYPGSESTNYFHIKSQSVTDAFLVYIDDLSVVEVGDETETNLIKNGGFETYTAIKPAVSVTPDDSKLTINWTNPAVASTAIAVTVGGEAVDISSANLDASAANSVTVTGLTNNEEYEIVVKNTTAMGELSETLTAIPRVKEIGTVNFGWYGEKSLFYVTTEDSYSGVASVKMGASGFDRQLLQSVSYDTSSEYIVTVYAKPLPNVGYQWMITSCLGALTLENQHLGADAWTRTPTEKAGWYKYQAQYKPAADGNFHIRNNNSPGAAEFSAFIDNVSVVKVGDETNTNLIVNGDFETYAPAKVEITGTVADDGQVTLTWTNPFVDSSEIKVAVNGEEINATGLALTANASNTYTVTGLENGETYEISITAVTDYGDFTSVTSAVPRTLQIGTSKEGWGASTTYLITTEDSYTGQSSLRMAGKATGGELLQGVDYDSSKQYKVTLYAKIAPNQQHNWLAKAWLGSESGAGSNGVSHLNEWGWTITETEKSGWYKYESTYYPGADSSEYFHIKSQANVDNFVGLIDDVTVVEVGDETNTNIILNGGFESFTPTDIKITGYSAEDSQASVTWTNPVVASSGIEVTLNGETVEASSIDFAANASNTLTFTDLTNNEAYEVVITATTAYGVFRKSISLVPRTVETGSAGAPWYSGESYFVTTEDSYSGKASLKLSDALGVGSNKAMLQSIAYDTSSEYTITMYVKPLPGVNYQWMVSAYLGALTPENQHLGADAWTRTETDKAGWYKYQATYVPGADGNFHIFNNNTAGDGSFSAYIDDISVVKVGDETNTNIVNNGGFEAYSALKESASDAYCDNMYIYWTPSGNASYYKIYKVVDGERVLLGQTEKGTDDWFDAGSISEGDEFVITSVIGNAETDGITLKAELSFEPVFGVGAISENGDITITEKLTAVKSGQLIAGVKIFNSVEADVAPKAFVALYNNGKLVSVQDLSVGTVAGYTMAEAAVSVTVPEFAEGDDYQIKVFAWDDNLKSLCNAMILN